MTTHPTLPVPTLVHVHDPLVKNIAKRTVRFEMLLPERNVPICYPGLPGRFNPVVFEILAANLREALAKELDAENWQDLARLPE